LPISVTPFCPGTLLGGVQCRGIIGMDKQVLSVCSRASAQVTKDFDLVFRETHTGFDYLYARISSSLMSTCLFECLFIMGPFLCLLHLYLLKSWASSLCRCAVITDGREVRTAPPRHRPVAEVRTDPLQGPGGYQVSTPRVPKIKISENQKIF
jgi:hypothetical protein